MQLDLQFRPASYWDHAGPLAAILNGIKGQNRRRMVAGFVTGQAPESLGPLHHGLVADRLDERTRKELGALHPSWMGGEYLPDYLPGEVEIARIVLASVTQDVISVRARRRLGRGRIRYRIVDEYHEPGRPDWVCRPASSARPLTLAQLIALIEHAGDPDRAACDSLTDRIRDDQCSSDPETVAAFLRVESDFYPSLPAWFDRRAAEWLARRRRELEEGDDDAA